MREVHRFPETAVRAMVVMLALGGCDTALEGSGAELASDAEMRTDVIEEIVANLGRAGFGDDDFERVQVGGEVQVLLGGDAIVSLEASRTMAGVSDEGAGEHSFRHSISYHDDWNVIDVDYDRLLQTGERTQICVELGDIAGVHRWQGLRVGLENAAAAWSSAQLGLGLQIVAKSRCSSSDGQKVALETSSTIPGGRKAFATMPANGKVGSSIILDSCAVPSLSVPQATNLMMHMLGHTAGLHHTDWCGWASDTNEARSCSAGALPLHLPFSIPVDDPEASRSIMATNFEGNGTEWTAADQQALRVLYSPDFCEALDGRTIAIRRLNENRWLTGRGPGLRMQAWELGSVPEITEQQKFKVECNDDGSFALSTWYLGLKLYVARDTSQPADDHNVISTHIPSSNAKRWRAYRSKGQGRPRWGIELVSPNLGLELDNDESVVLDDHSKSTLAVFEPR